MHKIVLKTRGIYCAQCVEYLKKDLFQVFKPKSIDIDNPHDWVTFS